MTTYAKDNSATWRLAGAAPYDDGGLKDKKGDATASGGAHGNAIHTCSFSVQFGRGCGGLQHELLRDGLGSRVAVFVLFQREVRQCLVPCIGTVGVGGAGFVSCEHSRIHTYMVSEGRQSQQWRGGWWSDGM